MAEFQIVAKKGGKRAGRQSTRRGRESPGAAQRGLIPVRRNETGIGVQLDERSLPEPDSTFAVSCGIARLNNDYPELLLGQTHPFDDLRMVRVLVVRYAPDTFVLRSRDNEAFREGLEAFLNALDSNRERGAFLRPFEAEQSESVPSVVVDAELEWMVRNGHRTGITFLATSSHERNRVATGMTEMMKVYAPVEASMPARVLADLLASWKAIADEMAPRVFGAGGG